jgi:hypothetical protein
VQFVDPEGGESLLHVTRHSSDSPADFFGADSKGKIRNKAEMLERMRTDTDTYTYSKNDSMDVHVYGPNIATVSGTSPEKGKDKNWEKIQPILRLGRYVDGTRRQMAMHRRRRRSVPKEAIKARRGIAAKTETDTVRRY